jgi:hypothetical protein
MKIKNPTIVTALFDIGRDTWDSYGLSYDSYLYWFKNLLMYNTNMVIYTETKFLEKIKNFRKISDPNFEKTIFIIKNLEDLDTYKLYFERIKKLMSSEDFQKKKQFDVPEMTKPLYNIVIFNKLFYIKESIEKKHFNSDFFIWMDAGVLREDVKNVVENWPNLDKINENFSNKITFFTHQIPVPLIEPKVHLVSQYRGIHGGCFFIPNNQSLNNFIDTFLLLINSYLSEGYVGSEEKYYDFCYLLNPKKYNLIKSDWRQYFNIFI